MERVRTLRRMEQREMVKNTTSLLLLLGWRLSRRRWMKGRDLGRQQLARACFGEEEAVAERTNATQRSMPDHKHFYVQWEREDWCIIIIFLNWGEPYSLFLYLFLLLRGFIYKLWWKICNYHHSDGVICKIFVLSYCNGSLVCSMCWNIWDFLMIFNSIEVKTYLKTKVIIISKDNVFSIALLVLWENLTTQVHVIFFRSFALNTVLKFDYLYDGKEKEESNEVISQLIGLKVVLFSDTPIPKKHSHFRLCYTQ